MANGKTDPQTTAPNKETAARMTRRGAMRSIGSSAIGATFAATQATTAAAATATATADPGQNCVASIAPAEKTGKLPFANIRIMERCHTLAGRLAGQLFADQGADVYVERASTPAPAGLDDAYFNRGKTTLAPGALADTSSADIIIVDGQTPVRRAAHQVVLRITAALPGDEAYGHLAADCSEDLLNALVGFFTDMSITGPMLGRPVIYSPLPLCSVYAGVNGAIAVAAALVDRERTGQGREIIASRLAGGLSAIGALSLTSTGIPKHLQPITVGGLPVGMSPEQFKEIAAKASADPAWQLWLEQRFAPLAAPYVAADGRYILPMAAPNRRLTRRALQATGLWDKALAAGMVDVSSYDAANTKDARRNLGDSMALSFDLTSKLADMLTPVFASRTAAEWEHYLKANGVPCTVLNTWEEWQKDAGARAAKIFAPVRGHKEEQIGRAAWIASAQPYPDLQAARRADRLPPRSTPLPSTTRPAPNRLPLAGYTLLDLTNVVAGPNCGRMFVELGASVINLVPMTPFHSATIVVTWAGESMAGKRSLILDTRAEGGMEVLRKIAARADFVLANLMDDQLARLRLDPVSLAALNPAAIGLQISALRGEQRGPRHNDMGYDPAQQGSTGIMTRFGAPGAPTYHGIASCVDYLCGYLGTWAGMAALYAREHRRDHRGDWAETSLATAATLTQLLLQRQAEPVTARGPFATGMNAGERVYKLSNGWIFAQGSHDLSAELASLNVAEALQYLAGKKINAVPVQTCRQVADRHRTKPSRTIRFERTEKDGWATECFAPTWYVFDNQPASRPAPASRIGADATAVLSEFGYTPAEISRLVASGAVGRTEWAPA